MRVNLSIEARMGSRRLPGKVLKEVAGMPMLALQIERCRRAKTIDDVIVATTVNSSDEPIVELCQRMNVPYYRGSEQDVLGRIVETHKKFKTDLIVELTGDNPLQDPELVDECVNFYLANDFDYVCNSGPNRRYPDGMNVQVFSADILSLSALKTTTPAEREHVSKYIYSSGNYKVHYIDTPKRENLDWPELSFTVDTEPEFRFVKEVAESFPHVHFSLDEMLDLLRARPELRVSNRLDNTSGLRE
jgi:spore coat polysaccharide biosynthesis protein SpsF